MAFGIVTCVFVLALACLSLAQLGIPVGPIGPPGPSIKLKSCPVDAKIEEFLKLFRTPVKLKRPPASPDRIEAPGRPILRRARGDRKQRSTNNAQWLYNCQHVGYNHDEQLVEKNTQNCCEDCRFPKFTDCAQYYRHHPKIVGEYVCNSKAIRCITNCINKKNASIKAKPGSPGQLGQTRQTGHPGQPGQIGQPGQDGTLGHSGRQGISCTTTTKEVNGFYCLENSCIKV